MKIRVKMRQMPGDVPKREKIAMLEGRAIELRGWKTYRDMIRSRERAAFREQSKREIGCQMESLDESRILSYIVVMSEYGRLWQQASDIRDELKKLVSHATTNTLTDAKRTCADSIITARDAGDPCRANRISDLLETWTDLEQRMAACDD